MARLSLGGRVGRRLFSMGAIGPAVAIVMLAAAGMTAPAFAGTLSKDDQKCLACHQSAGMEKQLASGETLSLHISGDTFAQSVHSMIGCTGCHSKQHYKQH